MTETTRLGDEIIMAGIGGTGVLVAGQVLAWAAQHHYKYVSWVPSYAAAKRGWPVECTVIFSDEEIDCSILDEAKTVMVFESSQFEAFQPRVRSGGLLITEKSALKGEKQRQDIALVAIPGLEAAASMGEPLINNLILLGAYIQVAGTVPVELIEAELERRYEGSRLELNRQAFQSGLELAREPAKG